jgi:Xaa-Pro aminopeptidase
MTTATEPAGHAAPASGRGPGDPEPRLDRGVKRARLLELLDRHGAERIVLTSATALGWYLDGARTHVSLAAPPIVAAVVDPSGDTVLATDNEVDRLIGEELPAGVDVRVVPWDQPLPLPAAAGTLAEEDVAAELRRLRVPLLPTETARYSALGAEVAAALTRVLGRARPQHRELDVAAEVTAEIVRSGAEPLVVLVGGGSRTGVRHPLPTSAPLGRRALVVVCARRHGLIVNLSRSVAFAPPTAAEEDAQQRILAVEAAYFDALVPGTTLATVFRAGCRAYGMHGFDPDEWRRHHQGGVAGYAGRDPRATNLTDDPIRTGQAFAWNPTGDGAKVEDTVLLTEDGLQVLTVDPDWPTVTYGGRRRPDILRPYLDSAGDVSPAKSGTAHSAGDTSPAESGRVRG